MDDIKATLQAGRWIALAIGLALWIPTLVFLIPILHTVRNSPTRLRRAEYRYRSRTRHWSDYEPVFLSHKPL